MKKYIFALLSLIITVTLSGCSNIDERVVTYGEKTNTYEKNETVEYETVSEENIFETASETNITSKTSEQDIIDFIETEIATVAETETVPQTSEETTKSLPDAAENTIQTLTSISEESEPSLSDITGYRKLHETGILTAEINGHIYGLMPCWGTYSLCDEYAKNLNDFAARLPDVNVYSMIIPTAVEFYHPSDIENFTASQLNKINYITEELVNVTNIDAYGAVRRHVGENIYARTDHHWQPLGAYYAAKIFSETTGADFTDISEYQKVVKSGYVGSMYNYTKDINLYNDPEDFVLYIPPDTGKTVYYDTSFENGYESELFVTPDGSNFYCSFLGSDDRIAEIQTNANTGRVLVIFKESFGNALVPFLTSGFDEIYVCDIRYFNLNAVEFCKQTGATDLLFAVCTQTSAGPNGKYLGLIK